MTDQVKKRMAAKSLTDEIPVWKICMEIEKIMHQMEQTAEVIKMPK